MIFLRVWEKEVWSNSIKFSNALAFYMCHSREEAYKSQMIKAYFLAHVVRLNVVMSTTGDYYAFVKARYERL